MRALGLAQPGSISAARLASASAAAYFPVARLLEGEKSIIDESAGSKESFAVENKILKPRNKRKPHAPDRGAVAVPSRVPGLRRDGSAVLPQRGFKVAQHERVVSFLARVVADAHLVRGRRAAAPRAVRQRRVVVRMRAIRLLRALRVLLCRLEVSADASGAARIIARAADDAEEVAGRERVAKVPLELRGLRGTVGARVVQIFRGDYARGASGAGAVRHGAPRIARRRRQGGRKELAAGVSRRGRSVLHVLLPAGHVAAKNAKKRFRVLVHTTYFRSTFRWYASSKLRLSCYDHHIDY